MTPAQMPTATCRECGTSIEADVEECPSCGLPAPGRPPATISQHTPAWLHGASRPLRKRRFRLLVVVLLIMSFGYVAKWGFVRPCTALYAELVSDLYGGLPTGRSAELDRLYRELAESLAHVELLRATQASCAAKLVLVALGGRASSKDIGDE